MISKSPLSSGFFSLLNWHEDIVELNSLHKNINIIQKCFVTTDLKAQIAFTDINFVNLNKFVFSSVFTALVDC